MGSTLYVHIDTIKKSLLWIDSLYYYYYLLQLKRWNGRERERDRQREKHNLYLIVRSMLNAHAAPTTRTTHSQYPGFMHRPMVYTIFSSFVFFFSKFPTHKLYEYYSNWYGGCVVSTILAVDSALMSSKIEFIMPFETRSFFFLFSRSFHERRSVLCVMLSEVTTTSLNQP